MSMKTLKLLFLIVLFSTTFPSTQAATRQMEKLGRGFVVLHDGGNSSFLSWRLLADDPIDLKFNVYRVRNGVEQLINKAPLSETNIYDKLTMTTHTIILRGVINGVENPEPLAVHGTRQPRVKELMLDVPATVNGIYKSDGKFYSDVVYSYSPGDA